MKAVQYVRSVPRYLAARLLGSRWEAVYTSPFGCVRLREVAPPRLPGPAWVRVRPRLAGICGSDLATLTAQGSTYFDPFTSTPFTFGHEVVGEVVEVGAEAGSLRTGDRVVLQPALHCVVRGIEPRCAACTSGHAAHCHRVTSGCIAAGIQTGYCADTGGGWSESLVAHQVQLHSIPASIPDDAAVLVEPFACCLHAALAVPLPESATAVVLGAGTIGALTVAALRAAGARGRIVVAAKHAHQASATRTLGADVLVAPHALDQELAPLVHATVHRRRLGRPVWTGGADVVFDCVGSQRSLDDALRVTRHQGTVVVVGMPGVPRGIDWTSLWHKELVVRGAYTSTTPTFRRALEHITAQASDFEAVSIARFPLARFRDAIHTARHAGRAGVMKTAFVP
jgi:threonine dehydrogenase-like Zn-dependent dehydrogenase